ncbi:MAG: Ig-like domain repeat protein, partial [Candidatus Theseobacter exili]|nr:Ig-like domain repeat protein [Candidatus Theseobacter exili]
PKNIKTEALSHNQISLSWDNSHDNIKVAGYRIYRNSAIISSIDKNTYLDSSATDSTEYSYNITAYDTAGNESGRSETIIISTPEPPDTKPPSAPKRSSGTHLSPTHIRLTWSPSTDNTGVTKYKIYRNNSLAGSSLTTSFSDSNLKPSSSYIYSISASDEAGNESKKSVPIVIATPEPPDSIAPDVPGSFNAIVISQTQIDLNWKEPIDNIGVDGYKIYRNGKEISSISNTSYSDTKLSASTVYSYSVISFDKAGNESSKSIPIKIETLKPADIIPPNIPENLISQEVSPTMVKLIWNKSNDNIQVTGYKIYRDGKELADTKQISYSDYKISPLSTYVYSVSAFDEAGNESKLSNPIKITTPEIPDTIPPNIPGSFNATAISPTQIDLNWNNATDNKIVSGYKIYRNGKEIFETQAIVFSDKNLKPATTYTYQISALDKAGNESDMSSRIRIMTLEPPDITAPSIPESLTAKVASYNQIIINWSKSADNLKVAGYKIYRDGKEIADTKQTSYSDDKLVPLTTYIYSVSAFDETGNESKLSNPIKTTTPEIPDTIPPSIPESFNATAISPTQINLKWNPSTDNKSITGYTIYRNGTEIFTIDETAFSDKNLEPSTSYTYAIIAFDKTGNKSDMSTRMKIMTLEPPDITAPGIPASLKSSDISISSVSLSWLKSTDNVQVTGYKIYRDGKKIDETKQTTYSDDSLIPLTTYIYSVSAFDEAGNESKPGKTIKISTLEPPDTMPPSIPESFNATAISPTQIDLSWTNATDNKIVSGYKIYRNGKKIFKTQSTTFSDKNLKPSTAYNYHISALDKAENESDMSSPIKIMTPEPPDITAPSIPEGLRTKAVSYNQIIITWNKSTDNKEVTGYMIHRNGELLNTSLDSSYSDRELKSSSQYIYSVASFDAEGNESNSSIPIKVTTPAPPDTEAPETPREIKIESISPTKIHLQWAKSTDNVKVSGYKIFRDGKQIAITQDISYSDVFLKPLTLYTYSIVSYDESNNESKASVSIKAKTLKPFDTIAPSTPGKLTCKTVSYNQIDLQWDESKDNTGVSGYKIYRNNNFIKAVSKTAFSDINLKASTEYTYRISAFDEAGNESKSTISVAGKTFKPPDTIAPTAPEKLRAEAISHKQIDLFWNISHDDTEVKGYTIYRNGNPIKTISPNTFSDKRLAPSSQYSYQIIAIDLAGNNSKPSPTLNITTQKPPDTIAPSTPGKLNITAVSHCKIDLNWSSSTDNIRVKGYTLYRNGKILITTPDTMYSNIALKPSTQYSYSVSAFDKAGNESKLSNSETIITPEPPDIEPPSITKGIKVRAVSPTQIDLNWEESTDNKRVGGYIILRNNKQIFKTSSLQYSDKNLTSLTTYSYSLISYDDSGNKSKKSSIVNITTPEPIDTKAPSVPENITIISISPNQIELKWNNASDNVGVAGYKIYRNGDFINTVSAPSYSDTNLIPSSNYTYHITAFDKAGNESTQSKQLKTSTPEPPDTNAPSIPNKLKAKALSPVEIYLNWNKSTDDTGVSGYLIYRNGNILTTITGTSYSDKGLSPSTQYEYNVSAFDETGNESKPSVSINIITPKPPDTLGPTVPKNIMASVISPTHINLTWVPSSDQTGVTGYKIYRNGKEISETASAYYSDKSLKPSEQYMYSIKAFDKAGNESNISETVNITTPEPPDIKAPSIPKKITAKSVSYKSIDLIWNPSTDNIGVTGYIVYRNGKKVGKSLNPNYSDTSLQPLLQYTYSVSSFDKAGNISKQSRQIKISTTDIPDTQAPTIPAQLTAKAISPVQVNLKWKASIDNKGIVEYAIYRNNQLINTTSAITYSDDGLTPLTEYIYFTKALDKADNESKSSKIVKVSTPEMPDIIPPSIPRNLQAKIIGSTQINLEWNTSTDAKGIGGYKIYRNNAPISTTKELFYADKELKPSKKYKYTITAFDTSENESNHTRPISVSTPSIPKIETPKSPANLEAIVISPTQIDLSWSYIKDNSLIAGYKIYRNGTLIHTTTQNSYSDTNLKASTEYQYDVTAYSKSGKESKPSEHILKKTTSLKKLKPLKKPISPSEKLLTSKSILFYSVNAFLVLNKLQFPVQKKLFPKYSQALDLLWETMEFNKYQLHFACFLNTFLAKTQTIGNKSVLLKITDFLSFFGSAKSSTRLILSAESTGGTIYRITSQRNSTSWAAKNLIDQSPDNPIGKAWSSKQQTRFPQDISIGLSSWAILKQIRFNTTGILKGMKPKEISLYCSLGTKSRINLLNVSLDSNLDLQTFPLFCLGNERFRDIQIRIKSNHGNKNYTALTEIEIVGIKTPPPKPRILLSSPYAGDSLESGTSTMIRWSAIGNEITGVTILYSNDNGKSFSNIIATKAGNNGSYEWKIPSVSGSDFRIKISALDTTGQVIASDQTPADFVISRIISSAATKAKIASFSSQVNNKTWAARNVIDGIIRRKSDGGGAWSSAGNSRFPHRLQIELSKPANPTQIRFFTKGILKGRKPKMFRVDAYLPESGRIINLLEASLDPNKSFERFDLPGLQHEPSKYIQIEINSNYGDQNYTSLSEIQIYGCETKTDY